MEYTASDMSSSVCVKCAGVRVLAGVCVCVNIFHHMAFLAACQSQYVRL